MPRRLSLPSPELIRMELYFIYSYAGTWEIQWHPLQGSIELPIISKEVGDHALRGWTKPLVDKLGPPPEGMLRKLPSQDCAYEKTCTFFDERWCKALSKRTPWCFEPMGFAAVGTLAAEIVRLWKDNVHIVVVEE